MFTCRSCEGEGYIECPKCDGTGFILKADRNHWLSVALPEYLEYHEEDCSPCNGTGIKRCIVCFGSGEY